LSNKHTTKNIRKRAARKELIRQGKALYANDTGLRQSNRYQELVMMSRSENYWMLYRGSISKSKRSYG
jgi:type IV secretory pathway VirB9-like protein